MNVSLTVQEITTSKIMDNLSSLLTKEYAMKHALARKFTNQFAAVMVGHIQMNVNSDVRIES